ncbi:MAG: hypothetical protein HGA53_01415 [Anaerolineaceae bacterium]|nr:hypothetical protein [Anaerolineaceae bacterium]
MTDLPKTRQAVVIKAWHVHYPDPLVLQRGEQVTTHQRDDEFLGWIFCEQTGGKQGWVPESWLTLLDGGLAVVKQDYNAVELELHPGEKCTLHQLESGWYWATHQNGQTGWAPADCLELFKEKDN